MDAKQRPSCVEGPELIWNKKNGTNVLLFVPGGQ
jgi:hypothetical protein